MKIETTEIRDVLLLTPDVFRDERGYFFEGHLAKDISKNVGKEITFVQGNISFSVPHTLRGLHYQLKEPQGKLIRCLRGSIYDVAVDIRRKSSTFGQWVARELSEHNMQALYVPPGFAHGFFVGSQISLISYECTSYYDKASDRALNWNDPTLRITWPLSPTPLADPVSPVISQKDRAAPTLDQAEVFP